MSAAAKELVSHIVDGALNMTMVAASMNDRTLNLSDPQAKVAAEYISTGTIAYLNHLAERYGATGEMETFYQKVADGLINGGEA